MLDSFALLRAMTAIDPAQVEDTRRYLARPRQSHGTSGKKIWRTALLAAVLASLFGATAYALGYSIHQRRQEELRGLLGIEEHHVASYVEYAVPEEETELTLLSALNDGEFQRVYVNVSPISEEELRNSAIPFPAGDNYAVIRYGVQLEGRSDWNAVELVTLDWDFPESAYEDHPMPDGSSIRRPSGEAMLEKYREQSYDGDTQTLTLRCWLSNAWLAPGEQTELRLAAFYFYEDAEGQLLGRERYRDLGTVAFTPVTFASRNFYFPEAVVYENPETGEEGRVLGLELSATGITWFFQYDDDEYLFSWPSFDDPAAERQYRERQRGWANANARLEGSAVLQFDDGSRFPVLSTAMTADYVDGLVRENCPFAANTTIDMERVVSVSIGGKTFALADCADTPMNEKGRT